MKVKQELKEGDLSKILIFLKLLQHHHHLQRRKPIRKGMVSPKQTSSFSVQLGIMTNSNPLNSDHTAPDLERPWFQEQYLSLTPGLFVGEISDVARSNGKSSVML